MNNNQIINELVEEENNFCEFVHVLVKQCRYSIVYDQCLMESLISWLISLFDSQVRAFRHTTTLAAMELMTALVDVALLLSVNLDNNLVRQYEMEKCEPEKQRLNERLGALNARKIELTIMLSCMFKSLFVYRYRDCVPEIRAVCIYEIGIWMKKFANPFLDDSYLEYIGWTLNDKVADVRLKCLQALLPPLYDDRNEIAGKMELFINKFKNRIVQMANDKVAEVRDLVVQFVMEGEFPEHATYLVDSLIDTHPLMKDWVCMTDLFLEEAGRNEEPLDNKQKTSLIEIVTCCVEQSVTGEPPICREIDTERMNKEIKITDHFIGVLTQLLNLCKTDPKKIVNLMTISQYFELTPCKQNDGNLEILLRLINEIVGIHTDEEVLRTCAEFYKFLYDENYQFSRNVWLNKSQSIDTLVNKYRIASDNTIEETKYAMAACHFGLNRELSLIHTNMSVISKPTFRKRLSSYMNELRTITGSRASDVLREEDVSLFASYILKQRKFEFLVPNTNFDLFLISTRHTPFYVIF